MTSFQILQPTCASTAESGSSSKYISASLQTALARDILALYPPLKVTPLPPTSVRSPALKMAKSGFRQQMSTILLYFSSSYLEQKQIFSLMLELKIGEFYGQNATFPPSLMRSNHSG
ncbi:Hypothetical_protein [Hexamita inflata]|uniref:Hypothetical_protein n=1 Tax=Hexamita inflata TaxID=28002 RepID=A0AA86PLV2_9EUKA|nr:Hypothetical protein HINF_LOCUS30140 [Hexamita inflata]